MARKGMNTTWSPLFTLTAIALPLGLTAMVVVWALADPLNDPVGAWISSLGDRWGGIAGWYGAGPVDAQPDWQAMRLQVLNGDAGRGADAFVLYGCGSCHVIPGVSGAVGTVGPSLDGFADRAYIAGVLTNAPGDLTRWLINPPLFAPDTAMPDLGVSEGDAADMTAYLYTLEAGG